MRHLREGLKVNDLRNLVKPLVSIDEYQSKLGRDSDIIVLAFFVTDEEPAIDLNRFLEKGEIPLLDSEVSPAPTEDGLYVVFVELARNKKTAATIMDLVGSIKALTGEADWTFKPYGHTAVEDLTAENIGKLVVLDRVAVLRRQKQEDARKAAEAEKKAAAAKAEKARAAAAEKKAAKPAKPAEPEPEGEPEPEPDATPKGKRGEQKPKAAETRLAPDTAGRLLEFFRPSLLDDLELSDNRLVLRAGREHRSFEVEDFGRLPRLMESRGLDRQAADLDIDAIMDCNRLGRMLGPDWAIQRLGCRYVVAHGGYAAVLSDTD
jgi:hypothetical protein